MKYFPALIERHDSGSDRRYELSAIDGSGCIYDYLNEKDLKKWFTAEEVKKIKTLENGQGFSCKMRPVLSAIKKSEIRELGECGPADILNPEETNDG